jgi:ribosomal protein S18 acetylase RimI-like enzyme
MSASPIRPLISADVSAVKHIIESTQLFPSAMLDEMITFDQARDARKEHWLTYDEGDDGPVGVAYCAPEVMSDGTWNLYLIAVHPKYQRGGIGSTLVKHVEDLLTQHDGRILLVETSSLPKFEATRLFYQKCGFHQEARIREFYTAGEDKIVFWKRLAKVD